MLPAARSQPSKICVRCLSRKAQAATAVPRNQSRRFHHDANTAPRPDEELGNLQHYDAKGQNGGPNDSRLADQLSASQQKPQQKPKLSIRQQLEEWAASNHDSTIQGLENHVMGLRVANGLTRAQGAMGSLESSSRDQNLITSMSYSYDPEVGFVGADHRQVGDLVLLTNRGDRNGALAVYLGYFSGRHHFYSQHGKWLMSAGYPAVFSVAKFVDQQDLRLVLGAIPKGLPAETYQAMQLRSQGPSRHDGAVLLNRMQVFQRESEQIHQSNLSTLESAREFLAHETKVKYMSLYEITDVLLPSARRDDGSFSSTALYSVLTMLMREDIAFRALNPSRDCHRQDYIFEVIPKIHAESIMRTIKWVRDWCSPHRVPSGESNTGMTLDDFATKARKVVAQSRDKRKWTPHGTLEPSEGFELQVPKWSPSHLDFLNYLEWWASYDVFENNSRYHGYGSAILRALGLYEDTLLDQRTAWTFLQEVGHIDSRQIPSRYRVRLPETSFADSGLNREPLSEQGVRESLQPDAAADLRSEAAGRTVFCIDDLTTTIIDDGISLERTDKADEFWIHVHVADPASRIIAGSSLAKYMELIPSNIYLPGHFQAMLPASFSKDGGLSESGSLIDDMSLQSGSLALTFSAKVNSLGELLDSRIAPTKIAHVTYLEPKDVAAFCNEPQPHSTPTTKLSVGGPFEPPVYGKQRTMDSTNNLDPICQDDLHVLYQLAEALKARRLTKGAWPHFFSRPTVSVIFPPEDAKSSLPESPDTAGTLSKRIPGDPQIEVAYDASNGCSVVSNTMVLAGEIAARWCSERGIPAPFRRDPTSVENLDAAHAYVKEHVYPLISQGIEPGREHRGKLASLIGGTELSASPGPNFIMGVDMYTKVTSPLRRFGDLLAHWQIHAALAHEHKTGRKLDPFVDANDLALILPFFAHDFERTLVLLQMREKMIRAISQGSRDWIFLALIRGWRAADGSVPTSMRFTVFLRSGGGVHGEIDYFGLPATMYPDNINALVLIKDISIGDQFEVEIADIDVYNQFISLKAVKYLGRTEDSPPLAPDTMPMMADAAETKGPGA